MGKIVSHENCKFMREDEDEGEKIANLSQIFSLLSI